MKVLKEEKREIEKEIKSNEVIGNDLLSFVENSQANAAVKQKLRTYVQDVERITKLFLKLSAQLKRIVRQLNRTADEQLVDVQSLKDRRAQLMSQLEDAKELKDGIYVRGAQLAKLLPQIFGADQMIDYQYFVQMKSKLLVEAQEIDDKIAHGEEQKEFLEHS
ncbi:ASD2 domain containing protein [Trichuris trichiura]|uniref:ASD2 domain containing protein n=1 Tax=Trichuris trichiura TaxID=36087 RepID=A0A077Z5B0_TRITR|nr:ASD2 domain containing protein [Trichuris trichiura]